MHTTTHGWTDRQIESYVKNSFDGFSATNLEKVISILGEMVVEQHIYESEKEENDNLEED